MEVLPGAVRLTDRRMSGRGRRAVGSLHWGQHRPSSPDTRDNVEHSRNRASPSAWGVGCVRRRDLEDEVEAMVGPDYTGTQRPCLGMLQFVLKAMRSL